MRCKPARYILVISVFLRFCPKGQQKNSKFRIPMNPRIHVGRGFRPCGGVWWRQQPRKVYTPTLMHVGGFTAILKLSAFGARLLAEKNYQFNIHVNWVNETNQELIRAHIISLIQEHPKKQLNTIRPYLLPKRLWDYLLSKGDLKGDKQWNALNKKEVNRMVQLLAEDVYQVSGKTTFKEEFVTCGGVSLDSINFKTMQSKVIPNLYFAGEVLNIDGITGGFNFQAAWTTAFIAAKLK